MTDMRLFWQHVKALTAKEVRQILRDRSSLILGIIFPLILIVMFGQGITFDIRSIRLGIVALLAQVHALVPEVPEGQQRAAQVCILHPAHHQRRWPAAASPHGDALRG